MFKDLKNIWIAAFGFSVKNVSDGPVDGLKLHDDPYYYLKVNR